MGLVSNYCRTWSRLRDADGERAIVYPTGCVSMLTLNKTIIAIQTNLLPAVVPIGQALLIFQQTFGGAFFLAIAQTLFNSSLADALRQFAPEVDIESIVHAGANGVRNVVSAHDLPAVIRAYSQSVNHEFYMATACSSLTLITCLGMGWKKVTKDKGKEARDSTAEN